MSQAEVLSFLEKNKGKFYNAEELHKYIPDVGINNINRNMRGARKWHEIESVVIGPMRKIYVRWRKTQWKK